MIQKKNLDKFVHTLRNKPVVINHKDEIKDKDKVGEVFNVWYNPEDGWYWCDGIITDKTAQNLIEDKKWSVSCSYDFTKYDDKGGTENNIPYDIEFLDGEFSHLAIVDNPRYEGANIVFNSKTDVNNDKWITIKPNGEEHTGRHLLVKDGETVQEALQRTYGIDGAKGQQKLFDVSKDRKTKEDFKREAAEKQAKYDEIGKKHEENLKKEAAEKEAKKRDDATKLNEQEFFNKYYDSNSLWELHEYWEQAQKQKDESFEKETPYSKKDEDKHQKVRDLEDKAYKEFKTMYDNYIDKDGIEGWGGIPASRFDKAKEQFNKKYKDAFEKLGSDRFTSFEDFAKREDKKEDSYYEPDMEETYTKAYEDSISKDFDEFMKSRKEDKKVIDGLGTVEEVYTHKDGVKQYKINGQWYSEKIVKETQKLNKYKKYTVQDIRKKIQDKKIDELKDIYEKYTSRDKADIFPNLFERAAVGGNVPKDLWLEHNIKELIEQKQSDKKEDKKEEPKIKKTTVKMKSGKEKEIEYVDSVPEGFKKLEGAMTAPLGFTWYHNGKSVIDKDRKTILVKDKANNSKEQDMALIEELKKLITRVENDKGDNMINNEKEDKRKLIDEVGGILEGKVDDEIIRTIIKKMEEASYNESEAGSADNKKVKNEADEDDKDDKEEVKNKKVKNEDEEDKEKVEEVKEDVKEDVDNKCKNSKDDFFERMNKIYNSAVKPDKSETEYVSRADRLKAGEDYFRV